MKYKAIGNQVFYLQDPTKDKWLVKEIFKTKAEAKEFLKNNPSKEEER